MQVLDMFICLFVCLYFLGFFFLSFVGVFVAFFYMCSFFCVSICMVIFDACSLHLCACGKNIVKEPSSSSKNTYSFLQRYYE